MTTEDTKTNASDQTVNRLRGLILDDTYPMGAPLRQAELAETLGVSRTPVREALKALSQEGLVEITSTGRTLVAKIDADTIQERFDIRCQLEMWMLELAIPVMTKDDIAKAEVLNERMSKCSPEEWSDLNFQFHKTLYAPANKPYTMILIKELHNGSVTRLRNPILNARNVERSLRDHKELIAVCASGDVMLARDRLESHIVMNSISLIERLRAIQSKR